MTSGLGRLPDFLVIGAMRSGTSSLARYLRAHPSICLATKKEVRFFDLNYDKGIGWYKSHFPCSHPGHRTGEATQTYLYDADALERMAGSVPDALLIAILRHPVERAYSHYWLNRARGRESLEFSEALEAETGRLARGRPQEKFWYSYVDRGRYAQQLRRVSRFYPRERILVVLFDDLVTSPTETFQSVCQFLEVDDTFTPPTLGSVVNPYITFRSPGVRRLTKKLPGLARKVVARLNNRDASYPPMEPSLRRDLVSQYEEEIASLEGWLGRGLSAWKR
jgi:hypothetical protein